jgi:hypothetical protein
MNFNLCSFISSAELLVSTGGTDKLELELAAAAAALLFCCCIAMSAETAVVPRSLSSARCAVAQSRAGSKERKGRFSMEVQYGVLHMEAVVAVTKPMARKAHSDHAAFHAASCRVQACF